MLKLLEEMLKQLTTWLNRVVTRLKDIDLDSCSLEYMEESLDDIQDLIREFDNQDEDFQSIKDIYANIEQSQNAQCYTAELQRLVGFSDTFKTKWSGTRNKLHMYKSYLLNRVAIYNEWLNEVTLVNEWIDNLGRKVDETKDHGAVNTADNNKILEDFDIASKSLERIRKTCGHLADGSSCVSAKKISQTTRAIESRYEEITSDFNYINKMNMNQQQHQRGGGGVGMNVSVGDVGDGSRFVELEKMLEGWLTEVEIKLINLRPYTSTDNEQSQLEQLGELKSDILSKRSDVERLKDMIYNNPYVQLITVNGGVDELNERYQQALKESESWIENLVHPHTLTE